ncbi:hypothetical protein KW791_02815 [Candidatus Parcubacteria bacterium]|nr:hypothetical protein [Candidatus Parcubacteria bacterium]
MGIMLDMLRERALMCAEKATADQILRLPAEIFNLSALSLEGIQGKSMLEVLRPLVTEHIHRASAEQLLKLPNEMFDIRELVDSSKTQTEDTETKARTEQKDFPKAGEKVILKALKEASRKGKPAYRAERNRLASEFGVSTQKIAQVFRHQRKH